ncbi:NADH dehydrogenase ubiquinone flavoprotein 2 [Anaeramoeba ignava]|uniref:NADH dehydrogenase ubiquinone flavoprotein 2 n=1 Tax=Anaeramoeba ignava TaxID=1746090 RepID=A0A9Q0LN73_ANAIG|nr:NADH dehydrogenase ubiquinone flavoprotein 2 [Anaeramoeba ignava]
MISISNLNQNSKTLLKNFTRAFVNSKKFVQPESFSFTKENQSKVKDILKNYPEDHKESALIPLLSLAQDQEGWISNAAINEVCNITNCPRIYGYQTTKFYSMFRRKPIGKHLIEICTCTPCMLNGAEDIVKATKDELKIDLGESTEDGKFTLTEVECQGACANSPVMVIDGIYYENLKTQDIQKIISQIASGKKPKPGPQNEN